MPVPPYTRTLEPGPVLTATEIRTREDEHRKRIVKFEHSLRSVLSTAILCTVFAMYNKYMTEAIGDSIP